MIFSRFSIIRRRTFLLACLLPLLPFNIFSQKTDTIRLQSNQILLLKDTIYFGIKDSALIVEEGTKYKIKKEKAKTQKLLLEGYMSLIQRRNSYEAVLKEGEIQETRKYFEPYKGKVIRKIYLKQVDLLEGSVADTAMVATTGFGEFLNRLHKNTRPKVIINSLRFKEHDKLNEVIMAENERLLRGLPYIEDAKIYIRDDNIETDSVDVYIVTKDNFPIGAGLDYKDIDQFIVDVFSRNVFGLGSETGVPLEYNGDSAASFGYGARYVIENIRGSFVGASIRYLNLTGIKQLRLNISKPFMTNDVRFGGEIDLSQTKTVRIWKEYEEDTIYEQRQLYKANNFDIWLGESFFPKRNVYDRFFNIGIRFFSENYIDRPYVEPDSNMLFHDNYSVLARLTYKKVNYFKAHKLLGYGVPEDVPVGYFLSLTTGYRKYEFSERPYIGLSASWTNTSKNQGYYLSSLDYSGSPANGKVYDNMVSARLIYFSPLLKLTKFEIRNILIPSFLSVNNPVYINEINFGQKIRKLNQDKVYGYSTLTFRYECFLYTPYSFIGFKTAISVFADTGWISSEEYLHGNKNYYGSYGLSIHIKNESLTIPTFSIQVAYFPRWKDETNKFTVSFNFSDLRFFKSFRSLKPSPYFLF